MAGNIGKLPARIVGGETIWISDANTFQGSSDIVLDDFTPADGSTLAYQFAAGTAKPITVSAVANGDNTGWTLEISGAQTLAWNPGAVQFVGMITKASRIYAVDQGVITVDASPLRVSSWVAVLASVDTAIANYATTPNGSMTVDGMSVSYRSMLDLTRLRDYAVMMLRKDSAGKVPRIIRSRFQYL